MQKLVFFLALAVALGFKDIPPAPKPKATIVLQPIQPTPIGTWIDTCAARYAVPREVILGVGICESGFGYSDIAKRSHNLFGIRKGDGWNGKVCQTQSNGAFRAYQSQFESIEDFCKFINFHYPHLKNKPVAMWRLYGYGNKDYEKHGFFTKFK